MAESLLRALLAQTVALTLAVVAVRGLQALVLGRHGAGAVYLAWLLVPVAMGAAALPHPAAATALALRVDVSAIAPAWVVAAPVAPLDTHGGVVTWLAAAWLAGALLLVAVLALRQRRFESTLTRGPGTAARLPVGAGPAVLGLLRPRIALPRDFESAFDGEEQRLMLLHEQVHLRRRDNVWNLLASALLVLHWFNPIAWWAARRLRADQELACDAAVLRRESPAALAAYAGALLKVQGVALTPPFATAWQSSHPLVERVRMLQLHRLSPARHRAGLRLAALSIVLAGIGGYALRAGASGTPAPASVMTALELQADSKDKVALRLLSRTGEKATVLTNDDVATKALHGPVELTYTVTTLDGDRLRIDTTLRQGEPLVTLGSPRVITRDGVPARIELRSADGAHVLAVTMLPKLQPLRGDAADLHKPPLPPLPPLGTPLHAMPPLPRADALPATPPVPDAGALPAVPALPAAPGTDALPAVPPAAGLPAPPQRAL